MKIGIIFWFCIGLASICSGQVKWDDTQMSQWPADFRKVEIISSADQNPQPLILFKSSRPGMPLIVSLHTWSGDFLQEDSISFGVKKRNWNYIHPNFRGPNKHRDACGSELVIADISDAIKYAISETKADPSEVHIIGVSGGGYAAMLCYMKLNLPVKSFSSWVGISDLKAWYFECKGRGLSYAKDILACTGDTITLDELEAERRSPYFMKNPERSSNLYIYAGVHDGYSGSVPITQSINFFNKLSNEQHTAKPGKLVSEHDQVELLSKQSFPASKTELYIGDRKLHYYAKNNQVSLAIFEGGHEMIISKALDLMPVLQNKPDSTIKIACLADNNGEVPDNWPSQLNRIYTHGNKINLYKSGDTMAFNNNGDARYP